MPPESTQSLLGQSVCSLKIMQATQQEKRRQNQPRAKWFEKIMALIALANFMLVLFDLTYIPLRDFYLQEFPDLVSSYDPVKGIEPHRDTQNYLNTVDQLKRQLAESGPQDSQVEALLESLTNQSVAIVNENPFEVANKSGTLEKIKNRMREHLNQIGAKQAFRIFWSQTYLEQVGWPQALEFFDTEIRPLMATNYFRPIGESGRFIDHFWRIDLFFIGLFSVEFLVRTFILSRRHRGTRWLDAMIWRWYDLFLLLPFWRWLRVLPVTIRLYQARLLNLDRVQAHTNRWLAENIAGEVTELVVVRTLSLTQRSIERGGLLRRLLQPASYVTINNTNEIEAIATHLLQLSIHKVYPQVQPDIEALLRHTLTKALSQSPVYRGLQNVPVLGHLPTDLAAQLASNLSQTVHTALTNSLEDAEAAAILRHLRQQFSEALRSELQEKQTLQEIQSLLADLLEELKLTYLQRSEEENIDQTLAEVHQLRASTDAATNPSREHSAQFISSKEAIR